MSNASNQMWIHLWAKYKATILMKELGERFSNSNDLEAKFLGEMLKDTSMYYYFDGLIMEREYAMFFIDQTVDKTDMWIVYLAEKMLPKHVFWWLRGIYGKKPIMKKVRKYKKEQKKAPQEKIMKEMVVDE